MDGSAHAFEPSAIGTDVSAAPAWTRKLLGRLGELWTHGSLLLALPNGASLTLGQGRPGPRATWTIHRWNAITRLIARGDLGFAEGYIAGEWDTPDLAALLIAFGLNYDALDRIMTGNPLLRGFNSIGHALQGNTKAGSRRNIMAHYDLGNDFYARWLDAGMTYSSALFDPPSLSLEQAQHRKYEALAHSIGIQRDHSVLEIGCGWGSFSAYAAGELGAKVTAVTLSPSQQEIARRRAFEMGLAERVDVQLIDYRDVQGSFDRIVSIEMFEAVGEAYWPTYFGKVHDLLKPDGQAGLQIITIQEALFDQYRKRTDFIQLHVFPGGMLPSVAALDQVTRASSLTPTITRRFGADYAETLRLWGVAFDEAWLTIAPLGFDERFRRLWRYYLAYCQAGFSTGRTDVIQMALTR